ncbi:LysR family transcriptional regulator [Levilactobacillus brevis]|uniref:LysR family transcriptional regulator n=1 Tax=Levilactobacillus brevis TaxID=1580 RepID=UPI000BEA635D|nr:LysR family transcriptional regulator [Levilactobacillus brevis]MCZ2119286.1 LysR family transcriptional regulator [Levilactobacillus brevis]MCZ2124774.1 LysR family transcriptional regulator [Levilactobacillus brevis]MCZ2209047.1 LysR family transcriptional regulator [Levilactobacillus brevis]MCZ2324558.1 LysR family transcriptional regulator [Levilactobacillus brevis]RDF86939.1 LysR family transcriptional regulator [Levilactobacillus brevis]
MEERQLILFVETAQLGSFQKTAELNLMSQRAVSKRISALEAEIGATLFDRQKNKINLTAAGKHFLTRATELLNTMRMTTYEVQQFTQQAKEQFSVGYFSPFEGALLRMALLDLPTTTNFLIEEAGIEHLISDVLLKKIDCAVIIDNPLFNAKIDQTDSPADYLAKFPVIYYSSEESTYLEEVFKSSIGQLADTFNARRVNSYEQMQLLVGMGKAISFYPTELIKYMATPYDHIAYLSLDGVTTAHSEFKLIYHHDNHQPLIKQIQRYFDTHQF